MVAPGVVGRLRRVAPRLAVMVGLACFVVSVYVVVVLGGGALIGQTDSPSPLLSVLATAVVALLFAPAQRGLERVASAGGHTVVSPYEVLSRFSETITGGYATEELPGRMARLLAEGTGAAWAQVWLSVSGHLTLAASWPADANDASEPPDPRPDARDATREGRRALVVTHGGGQLGVLRLQERPGLPLTAVEQRLFTGLAAQAGLALRLVGLRTELEGRHQELVIRSEELQASRQRLIEAQDTERRRLERDIHDGAQQHLVALTVNLRLAQTVAGRSPARAGAVLAEQAGAARDAIDTLSSLSRGIYPRLLSDEGLVPALRSAVTSSAVPVTVEASVVTRLEPSIEAALYFCCMEAVQNAGKHSDASKVTVLLTEDRTTCRLVVTDDGVGFDLDQVLAAGAGAGLVNMRDRLDAVDGTLTVASAAGGGTTVSAVIAIAQGPEPVGSTAPIALGVT